MLRVGNMLKTYLRSLQKLCSRLEPDLFVNFGKFSCSCIRIRIHDSQVREGSMQFQTCIPNTVLFMYYAPGISLS